MSIAHRRSAAIAASLAAMVLLAGCASTSGGGTGGLTATPSTSPPPGSLPSVDPLVPDTNPSYQELQVKAATLVPASEDTGLDSMPWKFLSRSPDQRSIQVAYIAGAGCESPVGFTVEHTRSTITVIAVSRPDTSAKMCADYLALGRASIPLPERLTGGVQLIHAPVAAAWSSGNLLR